MLDNVEFTPIEERFFEASSSQIKNLQYQVWIDGRYRVDFYIPEKRLIIELDGHDYHSSRDQRGKDAQRDRYLLSKGFTTIRFTGSEIYRDVKKCIREVIELTYVLPNCSPTDLSNRGINEKNPEEFQNYTYYCTYMQKVVNSLFMKYNLTNSNGVYIRIRKEGFDALSVGVLDDNKLYVAYTFSLNGDRCVDPEIILHRYFDIYTNRFELIPISFEHYLSGLITYAEVNETNRIKIYNDENIRNIANYIEGMARRIEMWEVLEGDVQEICMGEI